MTRSLWCVLVISLLALLCVEPLRAKHLVPAQQAGQNEKQVLAFYYPWYGNPEISKHWVHWTDVSPHAISDRICHKQTTQPLNRK